jgi:hypothetical protein
MDDAVGDLRLVGGEGEACFWLDLDLEELHIVLQEGEGREETLGSCTEAAHGQP